ncbi:putative RNA-directed DNA polymerase [Helianthus annuus]|nr:putative RNA-directed DNA polymerase [Helianthus annuus]
MTENQPSVYQKNPVMHNRSKHIGLKYHFTREMVGQELVHVEYCSTNEQVAADVMTKALAKEKFVHLRYQL